MDLDTGAGARDRLPKMLLAVVLGAVALRWFRRGKRLRAALAGTGALAVGFAGTAGRPDLEEPPGVERRVTVDTGLGEPAAGDAAGGDGRLRCSICGDPIVPGERRGPGPDDETVHVACEERRRERAL